MSNYKFAVLDPRSIPAAQVANDKVFAEATEGVLGIEVTVPALAVRCTLGNIDPQHSGGDINHAAIEVAVGMELPPDGTTMATVKPDLDSVGAMAIIAMRRELGKEAFDALPTEVAVRLAQVAAADKFARGGYPGPLPLPSRDNPWPAGGSVDSTEELAAIAACVGDFKVPMATRVAKMQAWLLTDEEPIPYRDSVRFERLEMIAALESGTIRAKRVEYANRALALVESTHRAATSVGYSLAPVVVARNPAFRVGPGEPVVKYTICAFEAKFADIKSALAELAKLEPGWGGSPTIGGSPQGVSSILSVEQVVEVVSRHLK